ncbi:ATP-dependent helicase HrpB [Spirochaetia bacterium]|nr:ATP-dependent helicase HrpB [Spirochaetia bacterium]
MNRPLGTSPLMQRLISTNLPLVPYLELICASVKEKGALVIRSDPGSGKSTLVPLALLANSNTAGKILMLEPRRAAALSIASRMADLVGESGEQARLGEQVGYAVRLERRVSPRTRIEVITEGLLVRRLQNDPELAGVSTIIFDEFHERSVHTDLSLAMVMDLRRMGSPVNIVVMSATMDAAAVAAFIGAQGGSSPVIDCPGRVFPVSIEYRPILWGKETAGGAFQGGFVPLGRAAADALINILADSNTVEKGNALVFLPGRREIDDAHSALIAAGLNRDFEVMGLYGSLPLDKQRQILSPNSNTARRIILSTNVAETGLTIPGITLVVDSGFARIERYHVPSGMNRLSLEPISRRSADQRAGRAGRLMPGRCIRLWAENDVRPAETDPEIRRTDLSSLVLDCLLWGVKNSQGIPWLEAPPAASWEKARELLFKLGAIDDEGRPTAQGRKMAGLGLEPRLAKLCIAGREQDLAQGRVQSLTKLGCAAAAILSDRDGSGAGQDPDFRLRLSILREENGLRRGAGAAKPGSDMQREAWLKRTRETAEDLLKRLAQGRKTNDLLFSWTVEEETDAGELLGTAFPDRIAKRRDIPTAGRHGGIEGIFRFVSGREGRLEGPLAASEWIAAAEVDAGERMGLIRLAAPISEKTALEILKSQITIENRIEWKGLVPRSIAVKQAGRISLGEEKRRSLREEIIPALPELLKSEGIGILPWDDSEGVPRRLLERIRFLSNSNIVDSDITETAVTLWTDESLINDAAEWLGPFVWEGAASSGGPVITGRGLADALSARLGWDVKNELDRLVPEFFNLPRGRRPLIDYSAGEPVLRIRLQDAFGISSPCEICSMPIVFHLLSPAGRPIQVTRDLPGFWRGSYAEVRKEMRGRYPKHNWPEHPA